MTVGSAYRGLVRKLALWSFGVWPRLGVHLMPVSYESPIPGRADLTAAVLSRRSDLVGVDLNAAGQLGRLSDFANIHRAEWDAIPLQPTGNRSAYYINNHQFETVDGEILYSMIRHLRPRLVIEVGSGFSTLLTAQALLKNAEDGAEPGRFVAIEPYPNPTLRTGFKGLDGVVTKRVQDVDMAEFLKLEANDVLFIDSSHVLRTGNDVAFLFLEVIPRLRQGVVVHIHDIFLPAEYPSSWILRDRRFLTEQYLLQAFLACNSDFEVLWSGSFMHLYHSDVLSTTFRSYDRAHCWPGSFWMRRTAGPV